MAELGGRALFLSAIVLTQALYLGSIWVVAPFLRNRGGVIPFVIQVTVAYAVVLLVTYVGIRLAYWERLKHVDDGSGLRVLGISPLALLRRTGAAYIDPVGTVLSLAVTIVCMIVPSLQVLAPLTGLCLLGFLGALLAGTSRPWEIRRRGNA